MNECRALATCWVSKVDEVKWVSKVDEIKFIRDTKKIKKNKEIITLLLPSVIIKIL